MACRTQPKNTTQTKFKVCETPPFPSTGTIVLLIVTIIILFENYSKGVHGRKIFLEIKYPTPTDHFCIWENWKKWQKYFFLEMSSLHWVKINFTISKYYRFLIGWHANFDWLLQTDIPSEWHFYFSISLVFQFNKPLLTTVLCLCYPNVAQRAFWRKQKFQQPCFYGSTANCRRPMSAADS